MEQLFPLMFLICTLFSMAKSSDCGLGIPPMDIFDYKRWSGLFRYTHYQGTYPDAGAADCQVKYWESAFENSPANMLMNKSYRYFDGNEDVVGSFNGVAIWDSTEGAAHWLLTLSQGDEYHISMVETDYVGYAAYVECDETTDRNFPIISSTNLDELDPNLVDRLRNRFAELGGNIENFVKIKHDDNCKYGF